MYARREGGAGRVGMRPTTTSKIEYGMTLTSTSTDGNLFEQKLDQVVQALRHRLCAIAKNERWKKQICLNHFEDVRTSPAAVNIWSILWSWRQATFLNYDWLILDYCLHVLVCRSLRLHPTVLTNIRRCRDIAERSFYRALMTETWACVQNTCANASREINPFLNPSDRHACLQSCPVCTRGLFRNSMMLEQGKQPRSLHRVGGRVQVYKQHVAKIVKFRLLITTATRQANRGSADTENVQGRHKLISFNFSSTTASVLSAVQWIMMQ